MKKILLVISMLFVVAAYAAAQNSDEKVYPDKDTKYLDVEGKEISREKFNLLQKENDYTFQPTIINKKVTSLQLKKHAFKFAKGQPLSGFTAVDMNGKKWELDALKGKTVVLNFWFTTCVPCIKEMPELNALVDKYKTDTTIVFLAPTFDSKEKVEEFQEKKGFKFHIIPDQTHLVFEQYGITDFPTTLIVNKDGKVAFSLSSYKEGNIQIIEDALKAAKG